MNVIVKPMSIERAEFISKLRSLITDSRLPPFVVEPILRDAVSDVALLSKQQLEIETKRYNEMIENANKAEVKAGVETNE